QRKSRSDRDQGQDRHSGRKSQTGHQTNSCLDRKAGSHPCHCQDNKVCSSRVYGKGRRYSQQVSRTLLQLDVQVGKNLQSKQRYSEKPKLHLHRAKTDDTVRRPGQLVFLQSNGPKRKNRIKVRLFSFHALQLSLLLSLSCQYLKRLKMFDNPVVLLKTLQSFAH